MNLNNQVRKLYRTILLFKNLIYDNKGYDNLRKLLKKKERNNIINRTIVFNTVKSLREFVDREFFIGKILAMNGAKIIFLLDDGIMKPWQEEFNKRNRYIYPFFHKKLIKKALKTYNDQNLKIIYYSQIVDVDNLTYNNLKDLKNHAFSSTMVRFKTNILDFNNESVNHYYKLSLRNAVISRDIGKYVLNKIKPDYFVTSHGIYSYWGPAYEFLKENGIKSLVYATSHSHSTDAQDIYFTYAKAQTLSRCKVWKEYKNTPVTKYMKDKVKELFNLRINHKTKDTKIYYRGNISSYKINKNNGFKYHIAIFPSLIWDGDIADRHLAFSSVLDWLISTIDYLKNRKDVKIYLKFHPAEITTFKTSAKIQDLIKDYLEANKIENLVLIPTELRIEPYEFLKSGIDLGICYDGVLALEMPYLKIPVLLGGVDGRFSVEGGNYTIKSKEEYFKYLENLGQTIEDFHSNYEQYYTNIVRYSYWYLFENVVKLPVISKKDKEIIDLLQLKNDDIKLDTKLLKIFS